LKRNWKLSVTLGDAVVLYALTNQTRRRPMHPDNPDGSFSAAELARLEREGILEIHQPGTIEHEAARQELRAEIEVADAEALAIHGPDALTSTRLLRQEAIAAERDRERVGWAFAAWCAARGWERSDLAEYLGVTVDQLAAMALERLPKQEWQRTNGHLEWVTVGVPRSVLAERYGADAKRLAAVLSA
jgi:hypothetical protein